MTWTCPIDGQVILPRICGIKFRAARMERGEAVRTSGRKPTLSRCLTCDKGKDQSEEKEETSVPNIYKQGNCVICGNLGKVFTKSEKCPKCANSRNQSAIVPGHKAPAPIETMPDGAEVPDSFDRPPAPIIPTAPMQHKHQTPLSSVGTITIDLTRVPGLTERLLAEADTDLRTVEAQALVILRDTLMAGSL
jgi:hypothetical protein